MKNKLDYVRFEVSSAVTMKNAVFWEVTPYGPCKIDVPLSPILVSLMMEVLRS
jgi:hypothetical protein